MVMVLLDTNTRGGGEDEDEAEAAGRFVRGVPPSINIKQYTYSN